jgi:hypothetical protein
MLASVIGITGDPGAVADFRATAAHRRPATHPNAPNIINALLTKPS